jgi:hypothetical protein
MIQRNLPDLQLRFLRLIEPLGGDADLSGDSAMGDQRKRGCRNMINMLNGSDQTELTFAAAQTFGCVTDDGAQEIAPKFRF